MGPIKFGKVAVIGMNTCIQYVIERSLVVFSWKDDCRQPTTETPRRIRFS